MCPGARQRRQEGQAQGRRRAGVTGMCAGGAGPCLPAHLGLEPAVRVPDPVRHHRVHHHGGERCVDGVGKEVRALRQAAARDGHRAAAGKGREGGCKGRLQREGGRGGSEGGAPIQPSMYPHKPHMGGGRPLSGRAARRGTAQPLGRMAGWPAAPAFALHASQGGPWHRHLWRTSSHACVHACMQSREGVQELAAQSLLLAAEATSPLPCCGRPRGREGRGGSRSSGALCVCVPTCTHLPTYRYTKCTHTGMQAGSYLPERKRPGEEPRLAAAAGWCRTGEEARRPAHDAGEGRQLTSEGAARGGRGGALHAHTGDCSVMCHSAASTCPAHMLARLPGGRPGQARPPHGSSTTAGSVARHERLLTPGRRLRCRRMRTHSRRPTSIARRA